MIAIIIIISFSFNPYFWKIELFWPLHLFIEESNVCLELVLIEERMNSAFFEIFIEENISAKLLFIVNIDILSTFWWRYWRGLRCLEMSEKETVNRWMRYWVHLLSRVLDMCARVKESCTVSYWLVSEQSTSDFYRWRWCIAGAKLIRVRVVEVFGRVFRQSAFCAQLV